MASESPFASEIDSAAFRTAIRGVMQLAEPENDSERVIFHWESVKTYTSPTAQSGTPYDLTETPATETPGSADAGVDGEHAVTCVLDWNPDRIPGQTSMGDFNNPFGIVYLLETEYGEVDDADYCTVDGDRYRIAYSIPPIGLGDVTLYGLVITAEDES